MHHGQDGDPSSDSSRDANPPQEAMDLEQALKIVSNHYVARNSTPPLLPHVLLICSIKSVMLALARHIDQNMKTVMLHFGFRLVVKTLYARTSRCCTMLCALPKLHS